MQHKSVVMQLQLVKVMLYLICLFFMQLYFGWEQHVYIYVISHGS